MTNPEATTHDDEHQKPLIDENVRKNVKSRNTWLRFFYMLVFALIMGLAELILIFAVIVQFFTVLLTGEHNKKLLSFGADMSQYIFDIWRYLTFVSEEQPFPFGEWRSASSAAPAADDTPD